MTSKWSVTLYNVYMQCGIRGPVCRTRNAAFAAAMKRAGDEFLLCDERPYYSKAHETAQTFFEREWPQFRDDFRRHTVRASLSSNSGAYTIELARA